MFQHFMILVSQLLLLASSPLSHARRPYNQSHRERYPWRTSLARLAAFRVLFGPNVRPPLWPNKSSLELPSVRLESVLPPPSLHLPLPPWPRLGFPGPLRLIFVDFCDHFLLIKIHRKFDLARNQPESKNSHPLVPKAIFRLFLMTVGIPF